MNIQPAVATPSLSHTDRSAAGNEVVSLVDRMTAARLSMPGQTDLDLPLWPIEVDPDQEFQKAVRQMMMQPFIEFLFYGEEEDTGNVGLTTML